MQWLPQPREHLSKSVKSGFQILDDLLGKLVWLGQVVQIHQTLVLEPQDIEAGLVTGRQFLVAVAAPAALGSIPFVPGGLATLAIARVVALDEFRQVLVAHRLLFERVVDVGPVVVVPDLLRPRVRAGFPVVEENHVGLDALGIEHAGRQAQDRVQVGVFQELLADGFARAALEQHVVRNDHGGASGGL